jgi:hypothetical protein
VLLPVGVQDSSVYRSRSGVSLSWNPFRCPYCFVLFDYDVVDKTCVYSRIKLRHRYTFSSLFNQDPEGLQRKQQQITAMEKRAEERDRLERIHGTGGEGLRWQVG